MMKFKKHGFVLLPAVLSIFILGLLGVSLASIYSDTFATLSAGKAASSAQQFAQIEAEYLKTLGFDEAATGKHTWNTMEKFVGDADGKEWESQVENVRHMQVSEDNAVDIYKISVRKKGDKTSAYSVEIPLSSQSGGDNFPIGTILPYIGELNKIPKKWALCDGTNGTPDLRDRVLQSYGVNSKGLFLEAGLPNITGDFLVEYSSVTGAFASASPPFTPNACGTSKDPYWVGDGWINFSASRSNTIYGKSTTVQPPAYTVYYIIKLK